MPSNYTPLPHDCNACGLTQSWFGLFPVRSPLLGESLAYFLFLRVLRCFTSPRWLPAPMYSLQDVVVFTHDGFPHSDIPGSMSVKRLSETFRS